MLAVISLKNHPAAAPSPTFRGKRNRWLIFPFFPFFLFDIYVKCPFNHVPGPIYNTFPLLSPPALAPSDFGWSAGTGQLPVSSLPVILQVRERGSSDFQSVRQNNECVTSSETKDQDRALEETFAPPPLPLPYSCVHILLLFSPWSSSPSSIILSSSLPPPSSNHDELVSVSKAIWSDPAVIIFISNSSSSSSPEQTWSLKAGLIHMYYHHDLSHLITLMLT